MCIVPQQTRHKAMRPVLHMQNTRYQICACIQLLLFSSCRGLFMCDKEPYGSYHTSQGPVELALLLVLLFYKLQCSNRHFCSLSMGSTWPQASTRQVSPVLPTQRKTLTRQSGQLQQCSRTSRCPLEGMQSAKLPVSPVNAVFS